MKHSVHSKVRSKVETKILQCVSKVFQIVKFILFILIICKYSHETSHQ